MRARYQLRRRARHIDGARRQFVERGVAEIGRADTGRALAAKHAQGNMLTLRPLDILKLVEPDLDGLRSAAGIRGVGRVGPRLHRAFDQRTSPLPG